MLVPGTLAARVEKRDLPTEGIEDGDFGLGGRVEVVSKRDPVRSRVGRHPKLESG